MNYIFIILILSSFVIALFTGRMADVTEAMFKSCRLAVDISISLIGIMAFWLGIVNIAKKSGLINIFSKMISPLLGLIFPDLKKDSPAFSNIALNISANALGLSNAATPFGINVMKDLKKESGANDTATDDMCIFLAMNTAGFQLVPAAVIAILAAAGADNPSEIILPVFIVTLSSFIFAILVSKLLAKIWKNFEKSPQIIENKGENK